MQEQLNKNNDEGMFGRDVMKILKEIGICKECDYPYGLEQPVNEIDPSIYLLAKNYCIKSYARIETLNSLKKTGKTILIQHCSLILGVKINEFEEIESNK